MGNRMGEELPSSPDAAVDAPAMTILFSGLSSFSS